MDKFQDAYRKAADGLPGTRMNAETVRDEMHHYRMKRRGQKILLMKGCTAAAVFFLCGAGTVAAKNFRESVIRVSDNGFTITGSGAGESTDGGEGIFGIASFLKIGGVFSIEGGIPEEEGEWVVYEPEVVEYNSLKELYEEGNVTVPILDEVLLGQQFTEERVDVVDEGRDVHIILSNEETCFFMVQSDNRGYESYSSGTAYMGQSCNERAFINEQGLSYVVFDTVDETGKTDSVHAVISVNGRDLTLTFRGFEESIVEKTLYALDLSVYYKD